MPVRFGADGYGMPRSLAPLLAASLCLLALTFASPARAAGAAAAAPAKDELLFTQSAPRATLEPTKCRCDGRYILTLRGVAKHTVWFSDRPNRHAGHLNTRTFARGWAAYGFASDPPDAALSALDSSGRQRSDVIELTHPRYDAKRRSIRYRARTVPHSTGPLNAKRSSGAVAGRLHDVSLFIDDATAPVVDGCLLVPYGHCSGPDGAQLSGAELAGADLRGVSLEGANLSGANLSGANLFQANLTSANLTGADLSNTNLNLTELYEANLTRTNLHYANMVVGHLYGVVVYDAILCHTNWLGQLQNRDCWQFAE